ncbi:MAG: hypothetical protein ACI9K2_005279 [Myxococcota bacterium]|jgi:hypothetical protein
MHTVRHTCLRCGGSCQGVVVVPVDAAERDRLAAHAIALRVDQPFDGPALRRNAGRCVFLDAHGCRLHAALGPAAKPRACRQFPVVGVAVRGTLRVGVDPGCYTWPQTVDSPPAPVHDPLLTDAAGGQLTLTTWADLAAQLHIDPADVVRVWRRLPLVPWLESLQTAPMIRDSLLPVVHAVPTWSPPPPWPDDPVGIEGLRRMAWLGLTDLPPTDLAQVGLIGGVGAAWARPGDPAPLAAWWRIVRVPGFAATVLALS